MTDRLASRRMWVYAALMGILAASAYLRFSGVADKGVFFPDEANYIREARLVAGVTKASLGAGGRFVQEKLTGADAFHWEAERARIAEAASAGLALGYAKPTHTLLVALSLLLLNDSPSAGNVMSAAFGTATIALLFFVARSLYSSTAAGLLAALILGLSAYHVVYSRETFPDAENVFFILLATYCYWRGCQGGCRGWLVGAGILAGLVYTANDRWAFLPILFLVPDLWRAWRSSDHRKPLAGRAGLLLGAMALPPILWEAFFYLLLLLSRRYGESFFPLAQLPPEGWLETLRWPERQVFLTYFEQLFFRLTQWTPGGLDLNLTAYPFYLWTLQGPLTLLLLLWPLGPSLLRRFRRQTAAPALNLTDAILWCQLLVPLAFFSVISYHNPRLLTLALPAIALLAAGGWHRWQAYGPSANAGDVGAWAFRAAPWAYAVGLSLHSLAMSVPALEMRTGLPEALRYLSERRETRHLSTNPPLSAVYVGEGLTLPAGSDLTAERARDLLNRGYPYLLVSLYERLGRDPLHPQEPSSPFLAQVFSRCEPAHVAEDRGDLYFFQFAYESYPNPADAALLLATLTPETRQAANRVYDLWACLKLLEPAS